MIIIIVIITIEIMILTFSFSLHAWFTLMFKLEEKKRHDNY